MKSSKSLPIPWKWFSTEHVTAPPSCLHTIISWGHALPLGLWPLLPLVLRESVKGGSLPILVSPPFSHMPGNALESTAPRWSPNSTLLWQKQSGQPPASWSTWMRLLFKKANQRNCWCSWTILFAFRSCMLSLIGENGIFSRQVPYSRSPQWYASREKAGRRDPGGFLKPVVPEGATPALVRISLLINSLMIRNLCIRISGRRRTPFLERRQTTLAYHQHRFCHRWVLSQPWFSSLHTSPL